MAEFVRAQIFGTTFEITSRFATLYNMARWLLNHIPGTRICSLLEWELSVLSGEPSRPEFYEDPLLTCGG